jgi:hypothetical protein
VPFIVSDYQDIFEAALEILKAFKIIRKMAQK